MFAIRTLEPHILLNRLRIGQMHSVRLFHQSRPFAVDDGVVKVGCMDEFHLTTLKRSKEFLVESAQKIYGKKVRIEIFLNPGTEDGKEKKVSYRVGRSRPTPTSKQGKQTSQGINTQRSPHSTIQSSRP
jgi:hypothetical protein